VRDKTAVGKLAVITAAVLLATWPAGTADKSELQYVVIVSRHGVRSPTWDNVRLNAYSTEPWPQWPVPPGNLTPHGYRLIQMMGAYYRQWLSAEHLLGASGCQDAPRIHIRADSDQRTRETGRAFAESLLPGCAIEVHAQPEGEGDPLFSGFGTPDPQKTFAAVRERLGADPQKLVADHHVALETLQSIVSGKPQEAATVGVTLNGRSLELTGPFATGSTFSEDLLLEYAEGMKGRELGWGRLTRDRLERVLEIHSVYADLMRRTPYLARARGSNLLAHVLRSLDQATSGKPIPSALGRPGDEVLLVAGHDTNLSNLSGMLGLYWKLPGYPPDDTPPGGALIFSLWRNPAGQYSLKLRYVAQSLDQMRNSQMGNADKPSLAASPESEDVALPGCPSSGCPWDAARHAIEKAIDPEFVAKD
jgi:4-phytase / acid phosphatase